MAPRFLDRLLAPWRNGNGAAVPTQAKLYPASGVHIGPVSWVGSPSWNRVFPLGVGNSDAERLDRATAFCVSAYCYVAMMWRMNRVAEPPLMVVQETEEGEEWQPDHELAELFDAPRPDLRMKEIVALVVGYQDLTGAAVLVKDRDRLKRVAQLTPFSGAQIKTETADGMIFGKYSVLVEGGRWKPVDREDVIHFRDTNPFSWRGGTSKVDVALAQLNLSHTVERITRNFLLKAMFPGGVLSPDKDWHPSSEEWEDWKRAVEAWNAGPANAGDPLMLQGGTLFSRVASAMTDLLPSAVLDRVEATVGSVFGIPPVVLGWLTGLQNSPWSQMSEARRQTYEDTIEPIWSDIEDLLTRGLLAPEERKAGFLIRFDKSRIRALQEDRELQSRISLNLSDVATRGERRLLCGLSLLGDERDDVIVGDTEPAPGDELGAGDEESDDSGEDEEESALDEAAESADSKDLLWLLFDLSVKASEPRWARVIGAHLDELKARVIVGVRQNVTAEEGGKLTGLPDLNELKQEPEETKATRLPAWLKRILDEDQPRLAAKAYPLLVSTGGAGVRRLAARLKISFSVLEPGLLSYAKRESRFLAEAMGKRTGQAVARVVQDGLAAGETINGLVKRLQDLPAFDRARAKLVARTETTRAWNGAQRTAMSHYRKTAKKQVFKSWLSARDARVRDEHAALDDETSKKGIPVDQAFSNGLMEPGEPNCRCSLTYEIGDDEIDEPSPVTE